MKKQLLLLLLFPMVLHATKIEKQGTLLNKECNGLGTRCKGKPVKYSLWYNEPNKEGLWIVIEATELAKVPELEALLLHQREIDLVENYSLTEEDQRALKMETEFSPVKGPCEVVLINKKYFIKLRS